MPSDLPKSRTELQKLAAALGLSYVGAFESGLALMLTDPTYAERQWDGSDPPKHLILGCPSGKWYAFVRLDSPGTKSADVPRELIACHEFCLEDLSTGILRLSECGEIPVSAGIIAIFDSEKRDDPEFVDELFQAPSLWITDERGVVVSTGGDGFFGVFSWQIEGAAVVVAARIYDPV